MKKALAALAGLACFTIGSVAQAQSATVTYGSTTAIPTPQNNFYSQLTGLGLNSYASTGATISLSGPAVITFYLLGSESGYSDTFSTVGPGTNVSLTENSSLQNNFASPILIGGKTFAMGSLANLLLFSTSGVGSGGANATVGDPGFGIFLPAQGGSGPGSVSGLTTLYFGYDDQITRAADDNHDDFIVKAVISSAVPEPATWAMMLLGFGVVGFSIRRRRVAGLPQMA